MMNDKDRKGKDKCKHFCVCFALAVVSPEFAIGAAFGKEYGDYKARDNHWCWWDIMYDAIGIVAGGAFHYTIRFTLLK